MGKLREALKSLIDEIDKEREIDGDKFFAIIGTVKSINSDDGTYVVTPADGGADIIDIYLQASTANSQGVVLIPSIGSTVVVTVIANTPFITQTTSVDQVTFDSELVQFNGGTNDGLINIDDLTFSINGLISVINGIQSSLANHVHPGVTVGAGITSIGTYVPPIPSTVLPFDKEDYEDTSVTH